MHWSACSLTANQITGLTCTEFCFWSLKAVRMYNDRGMIYDLFVWRRKHSVCLWQTVLTICGISLKPVNIYDVGLLNHVICTVSLGTKCILVEIALTLSVSDSGIVQLVSMYSLFKIFLFSDMGQKRRICWTEFCVCLGSSTLQYSAITQLKA